MLWAARIREASVRATAILVRVARGAGVEPRPDGAPPAGWSAPTIVVPDPSAPACDLLHAEIRAAGTILGVAVGAALAVPGGYNNQPVAVVVIDRESGLVVIDHRFHSGTPALGNYAAEGDLNSLKEGLATLAIGEFCDTFGIPRGESG